MRGIFWSADAAAVAAAAAGGWRRRMVMRNWMMMILLRFVRMRVRFVVGLFERSFCRD